MRIFSYFNIFLDYSSSFYCCSFTYFTIIANCNIRRYCYKITYYCIMVNNGSNINYTMFSYFAGVLYYCILQNNCSFAYFTKFAYVCCFIKKCSKFMFDNRNNLFANLIVTNTNYFTSTNSTSKIKFALAGIAPG